MPPTGISTNPGNGGVARFEMNYLTDSMVSVKSKCQGHRLEVTRVKVIIKERVLEKKEETG